MNTFDKIQYVLADREFVGKEWFQWLNKEQIKFCIRIKHNT
ncbi:transposase [Psychrobacter sp. van23A]